ncbi:hypothetical protein LCGC14_1736400 [marine sediment metagenome]|uniref:Uncharacterized protein n=1 Tax=marine sediment metagenome TaxID=412755 RepID=A0A0F9HVL6_9ZZZZ
MKKAYITVTNEFLSGMLMLPKSINVSGVFANRKTAPSNTFIVILKGDGLPEPIGGEISQHVTIVYEKNQDDLVPNVRLKEIKKAI